MSHTTPRKTRTVTEYRVVSVRAGNGATDKRYRHWKGVQDRIGRLTSDEPWRFYGGDADRQRDGSDLVCCDGRECGCGGETVKARSDAERADLPPIQSITVSKRTITYSSWEGVECSTVPLVTGGIAGTGFIPEADDQKPTQRRLAAVRSNS